MSASPRMPRNTLNQWPTLSFSFLILHWPAQWVNTWYLLCSTSHEIFQHCSFRATVIWSMHSSPALTWVSPDLTITFTAGPTWSAGGSVFSQMILPVISMVLSSRQLDIPSLRFKDWSASLFWLTGKKWWFSFRTKSLRKFFSRLQDSNVTHESAWALHNFVLFLYITTRSMGEVWLGSVLETSPYFTPFSNYMQDGSA